MIRILHLEDDRLDADLVQATLAAGGLAGEIAQVDSRSEFEAALDGRGFDLILSDHALPAFDGISALRLAQQKCPETPFIFVSGAMGEEAAIDSLRLGATDYVLKSRLSRLVPAVRRALEEAEVRAERKRAEAEREQLLVREQAARADAEDAYRRLRDLQSVTEAVLHRLDLDDLLADLLGRIRGICKADTASIMLLDEDRSHLTVRATQGLEDELERAVRVPLGRGITGRVAAEGRPLAVDDLSKVEVVSPVLKERGVRSLLAVPLRVEDRVTGVIHIGSTQPRQFTGEDITLFQLIADRVALAIEQARLYEAERQARVRAEAEIGVRQRVEAELRKLTRAVEHSPTSIVITDAAGFIEYVNPKFSELTGYEPEEVIGKTPGILKSGETPPDEYRQLWETITAGEEWRGEFHNRKKNGELYWESASISAIAGPDGAITHFVAVKEDITEHRRTQEEILRLNRDLGRRVSELQTLLDILPVGICVADDPRARSMSINPAGAHMLGIPPEINPSKTGPEAGRLPFKVLQNGREVPPAELPIQFAVAHDFEIRGAEYEIVHDDGRVVNTLEYASPLHDEHGRVRGGLGVFVDITDLKQAEAALLEKETRLRALVNSIDDLVIESDIEGTYVNIWTSNEKLLVHPKEELIGRRVGEVISEEFARPWLEAFRRVLSTGRPESREFTLDLPDGRHWFLGRISPIPSPDGLFRTVATLSRDITEKKKLDEEIQRASKLESIGVLAGGIAHDFNNLLTTIMANVSLVKLATDPADRRHSRLVEAEKASLRAKDLTQQLLTFAKGGAPIRKSASLDGLLKDSIGFALTGTNVRSQLEVAEGLWPAEVDEGQMSQVIQNLVLNAKQAMPQGGTVRVRADNVTVRAHEGLPLAAGRYIRITVTDEGAGIPEAHLPKIFDPFFTTKQKGSGLGLATAYAIVQKHEGHLAVESTVGVGTTFRIYLPASTGTAHQVMADDDRAARIGRGRLLVMDDEAAMRDTLREALAALGYRVELAADGGQSIELYRQAREAGQPFDAVILDLTVPGGMGGEEVVRRLRAMDPEVKAIVSSGYSNDPIMADFRSHGFLGVVAKPYTVEELSEVVLSVIGDSVVGHRRAVAGDDGQTIADRR